MVIMKAPLAVRLVLLVLVAAAIGASTQGGGAVLTVCPSGCQFSKIQDAINAAKEGDIIKVEAGAYRENLVISKKLTIQGVSPDEVMLEPLNTDEPTVVIQKTEGVIITGLTLFDMKAVGLLVRSSHVKVLSNKIITDQVGIKAFGFNLEEVTIQGNHFNRLQRGGVGIMLLGQIRGMIHENQILNQAAGIVLGGFVQSDIRGNQIFKNWDGIVVGAFGEATLIGNQVIRNRNDGIRLADKVMATLLENRISLNDGYGVSLWQQPCYDTAARFDGVVQGLGNEISGNRKGDLCPPDFPWPPGFKRG